ncbi:aminoglycoside phosphotransferase family protein [Bacillus sp. E(2018)]|uniref:aminoglycoside phosphotransferase family protein n=1 Tax=Bacillus sp. E(2018) TaxID=2502239 RepID=UPI00257099AB|nr:aminoglycoside phosphotransferase family protein [Bacillus sp. E(2018)]
MFTTVEIEHIIYRFVLFDWIEGHHITSYVGISAEKFGRAAREFQEIASQYTSDIFSKRSHTVGYTSFYDQLNNKLFNVEMSIHHSLQMKHYLEMCKFHLENAKTRELDFIVHSDLNPLNVLWDAEVRVKGFVDFESIGYTDRMEGLAWLIKWYSRTNGIHSREMSSEVAAEFLKGYQIDRDVLRFEKERLSSLLWLSGCLNWNFVNRTIHILEFEPERLNEHLTWYRGRGDSLTDLLKASLNKNNL